MKKKESKILDFFGKPFPKDGPITEDVNSEINTLLHQQAYHKHLAILWENMYKDVSSMATNKEDTDTMYIGQAIVNIMNTYLMEKGEK